MLGRVIGMHWHALVHDVLALGYRASDILTTLTLAEMVSIVVGAGPNTSVRFFMEGGWNRTDHLLANMAEQQAGIASVQEPFQRPGIEDRPPPPPREASVFGADVMTWEEMDERNKVRYTAAEQGRQPAKPDNVRVI